MFAGRGSRANVGACPDDNVIRLDVQDIAWRRFQKHFLEATGLDLSAYRAEQIRRRVLSVASVTGDTIESLADRLSSGPVLASVTLHQIAIHTTQLFRDNGPWTDLTEIVLPELARSGREIKAWCTACANGAEAYSLASILERDHIPGHILATDIDTIILEQAVKGRFTRAQARHSRAFLLRSHFKQKGETVVANPVLGRRIAFDRHNVLAEPPRRNLDLVCCRNVAIYLTEPAIDKLYRNMWRALRPGGYLFLGTTERLFSPKDFGFEPVLPCFYRKLRA